MDDFIRVPMTIFSQCSFNNNDGFFDEELTRKAFVA